MMTGRSLPARLQRLARDERGVMSAQNLLLAITCCAIGAIALDVTGFYQARTHLQVAADVGAHAALYTRHHGRNEAAAKTAAIGVATYGMPSSYGTVLAASNVSFGTWNAATSTFTELPAGSAALPSAARVVTDRAGENPVGSFLFRIVGIDNMDVSAGAVYTTYYPACLTDGFVAEGIVDIQSNNSFLKGFCLHSNKHVEMNQNNFFELGTIVSMPDKNNLVMPTSGDEKNDGIQEALRSSTYNLKELDRLRAGATLEEGVLPYSEAISTLGHDKTPWFLASNEVIELDPGSYGPSSFTPGSVHVVTCSGGSSSGGSRSSRTPIVENDIVLVGDKKDDDPGTGGGTTTGGGSSGGGNGGGNRLTLTEGTFSKVVIITDCEVQVSGQVAMEDTILYTSNTSASSISASSGSTGLVLGKDDDCAPRGGATILTRGGMHAAAKLQMYGGQVRLLGDFKFASGGNSEVTGEGVSVMAGGTIDGTTHMNISGCPAEGMDQDFETPFFVLAQ